MSTLINSSVGEYRLVEFLGAGGMGEVYRAVHSKIGRIVAVKVLRQAHCSANSAERFLNEARIQATLHHANIATLYDFFELNGQPCIIMEYVDGETLSERIHRHGALPLSEAVSIFRAVVEAVSYVHAQDIVHRDIKSNNIKVSATGEVKLLDFGIAKAETTPKLTMVGRYVGTLQYISPEQLSGKAADSRSDVWSLGVLLYEIVTGQLPFEAATVGECCDKIHRAAFVPPSVLNTSLPHEAEIVIARCLEKNPADRYQSARELLQDVRMLSGELIAMSQSSAVRKATTVFGKKALIEAVKDNWAVLLAVVALVFTLGVGIWMPTNVFPPAPNGPPYSPGPVLDPSNPPTQVWPPGQNGGSGSNSSKDSDDEDE